MTADAPYRLLADVNAKGGEYGNALQAASARGHKAIVKLLLDVNTQGGEYGSALQAASGEGHKDIVKYCVTVFGLLRIV
jgi:ankyrin repeat protein